MIRLLVGPALVVLVLVLVAVVLARLILWRERRQRMRALDDALAARRERLGRPIRRREVGLASWEPS